ncbi:MAG: 5'/3'-nucleotidase SurE [Candidatus Omnitrophica bacterium]|nr:5'/3'-nucleotidase SurE [Candidatus Omnitrophota bacterium]
MKILLTNDDGIHAEGLRILRKRLERDHECVVVAPLSQRSAIGHAITLGEVIEIEEVRERGRLYGYGVLGTPADCVKFALCKLFKAKRLPDLIISGINRGPNAGVSIFYSGTVSAAREGLIAGIPSMAVSVADFEGGDYRGAARLAGKLTVLYGKGLIPRDIMLNVNMPYRRRSRRSRPVRVTKQAVSRFMERFIKKGSSRARKRFMLAGEIVMLHSDGFSDQEAIDEGRVSITPLKLDLTDHGAMRVLESVLKDNRLV